MVTLPLPSATHDLAVPSAWPQAIALPGMDAAVGKNWNHTVAPGTGLPPLSLAVTVRFTVLPFDRVPAAAIGTGGANVNEATATTPLAGTALPRRVAIVSSGTSRRPSVRLRLCRTRCLQRWERRLARSSDDE